MHIKSFRMAKVISNRWCHWKSLWIQIVRSLGVHGGVWLCAVPTYILIPFAVNLIVNLMKQFETRYHMGKGCTKFPSFDAIVELMAEGDIMLMPLPLPLIHI